MMLIPGQGMFTALFGEGEGSRRGGLCSLSGGWWVEVIQRVAELSCCGQLLVLLLLGVV